MKEHIELEQIQPADIEARSFEIITQELGDRVLDPLQAPLLKDAFIQLRISPTQIISAFPGM